MKLVEKQQLDAIELRRVSLVAEVDPRTLARYLNGKPVRPSMKARIERALTRLYSEAR
jgi:hypothetical protein